MRYFNFFFDSEEAAEAVSDNNVVRLFQGDDEDAPAEPNSIETTRQNASEAAKIAQGLQILHLHQAMKLSGKLPPSFACESHLSRSPTSVLHLRWFQRGRLKLDED